MRRGDERAQTIICLGDDEFFELFETWQQQIATRAYFLHTERAHEHHTSLDDWLEARASFTRGLDVELSEVEDDGCAQLFAALDLEVGTTRDVRVYVQPNLITIMSCPPDQPVVVLCERALPWRVDPGRTIARCRDGALELLLHLDT